MPTGLRAAAWGLALALVCPAPAWAQGTAAAALARLNGELVIAAYKGDRLAVAAALARGAQLSAADANGYTPLHWAAYGGHAALAGDLLARGAPLEARTRVGQSPLMLAAWQGHSEVAELLLARGAQVGATSPQGHSAEAYARRKGHLALAERLAQAALPPKAPLLGPWCLFGARPAREAGPAQGASPSANGVANGGASGWAQATPAPRPSQAPSWSAQERLSAAPTPTPGPQAAPWAIAPRPSPAPSLRPPTPSAPPSLRPSVAPSPGPLAAGPSARPSDPAPASPSPAPSGPSPWAWWLAGEEGAPAWALGPSLGMHVSGLSFPIAGGQLRRSLTQQLALRAAYEQGGYQQAVVGANVAYQFQRYHLALLSQGRLYGGVGVVHVVLGNAWDGGNHPSITAAELIGGLRWPMAAYGLGFEPWAEFRFGLEGPSTANLGLAWRF